MAEGRIERKDLVSEDAITPIIGELDRLADSLRVILELHSKMLKENPYKTGADVKNHAASVEAVRKSTKALTDVEKEKIALSKQLKAQTDEELKGKIRYQEETRKAAAALKLEIQLAQTNAGSIERLTLENKKLTQARNKLDLTTMKGKALLSQYNKQINENTAKIQQNVSALEKQKMNIGNYTQSMSTAIGTSGTFGVIIAQLTKLQMQFAAAQTVVAGATAGATGALKIFRLALLSTGVGAIVVVIGALVAYFTRLQEGTDKLSIGMAGFGQVMKVIMDRVALLGGALVKLFSGDFARAAAAAKEAFAEIGDEMEREVSLARELKGLAIEIGKAEILLATREAKLRAEIAELKFKAKQEEQFSVAERIAALREAGRLERELADDQIRVQREKINNILGETTSLEKQEAIIAAMTKGYKSTGDAAAVANAVISQIGLDQSTVEDLKQLSEEVIKLIGFEENRAKHLKKLQAELNTLSDEERVEKERAAKEAEKHLRINADNLDVELQRKEVSEATTKELQKQAEAELKKGRALDTSTAQMDEKIAQMDEEAARLKRAADLRKKERNAQIDEAQETLNQVAQAYAKRDAVIQQSYDRQISESEKAIDRQARLAEKGLANELGAEEARAAKLKAERDRQAKEAEKRQKALAYITAFTEFMKDGDPNQAATKALVAIAKAEAISRLIGGSAFEGTEDTGGSGGVDNKGGKLWVLHPHERVINAKQNKELGNIANDEVVNVVRNYRLMASSTMTDERIIRKLDAVEKAVSQSYLRFDADGQMKVITSTVEQGMRKTITHLSRSPRL